MPIRARCCFFVRRRCRRGKNIPDTFVNGNVLCDAFGKAVNCDGSEAVRQRVYAEDIFFLLDVHVCLPWHPEFAADLMTPRALLAPAC